MRMALLAAMLLFVVVVNCVYFIFRTKYTEHRDEIKWNSELLAPLQCK
jgi:hypothetical protein